MADLQVKLFKVSDPDYGFDKVGQEALERMRALIPKRTGTTAANLDCEVYSDGYKVYGKKPSYRVLHLLENGTKFAAPHPFMRPVAALMRDKNRKAIEQALQKAVEIK